MGNVVEISCIDKQNDNELLALFHHFDYKKQLGIIAMLESTILYQVYKKESDRTGFNCHSSVESNFAKQLEKLDNMKDFKVIRTGVNSTVE